ncbi:50S ribosomal protein L1 [Desulfurococcaceae archaeon MEX13E-LK6-19]|nr:50S ribosomal protein L1 [Desulfurococcaceae archaeon MEX13E-LK6-19]
MPVVSKEQLVEAIKKAIETSPKRNFKQSIEMIIVLRDVDPRSPEGRIRETIFLPKGISKEVKVCVVADGEMVEKAKEAGAYRVITKSELQSLGKKEAKKIAQECDWVLVRTDLMAQAGRILGPALGPRGKIPVPVPPAADIKTIIERYKRAVFIRTKDQPQIMCRIGAEDMNPDDIAENALSVLSAIEAKLRTPTYNIAKVIVKTTMGPPIEVKAG